METLERLSRGAAMVRHGKLKAKIVAESKPFPKGAIMASKIHHGANKLNALRKTNG